MEFSTFGKKQYIAVKKIKLFLVHYTIKLLNCVVHYLIAKINFKMVEKVIAQLFSVLKWERV